MAIIDFVLPENAEGNVNDIYSQFTNMNIPIPLPLQMYSASPGLLMAQNQFLNYFMNHKKLSFSLLAHIRMLIANAESFSYCLNLNQQLLKTMGGLDEDQINATLEDPNNAVLDEKEKAMLLFVLKAVQDPAVA